MDEAEIQELRTLLALEAERYAAGADRITDEPVRLDASRAHTLVTTAEIQVFAIPPDLIPALQVAHMAYEELLDLIAPSRFSSRAAALIEKARGIVPPLEVYGQSIPFETGCSDVQSFQWFARIFFGLASRPAAAIYAKHEWNNAYLVRYADDD
jgi:hypothetical protein